MCNTIWGKVNFRLELYHYLFPECSSEERQLTNFFFSRKKKAKSNIEEQDICFCNYVPTNWDCAPPDVVLYRLSSAQAVQLISFCACKRISQVFRSSHGVFMHLTCQMAWEGMGHRAGGRYRGECHSVQREQKDFKVIVHLLSFTSSQLGPHRDLLISATSLWDWFLYFTLVCKVIKEQKYQLSAGQKAGFCLLSVLLFALWDTMDWVLHPAPCEAVCGVVISGTAHVVVGLGQEVILGFGKVCCCFLLPAVKIGAVSISWV